MSCPVAVEGGEPWIAEPQAVVELDAMVFAPLLSGTGLALKPPALRDLEG